MDRIVHPQDITVDDYAAAAEAWLSRVTSRKGAATELEWGKGSDNVALFKNLTFSEEKAHIDEQRAWQQKKSDAGFGSITWPVEFGGQGLSRAHELAYQQTERNFVVPDPHESVNITMDLIAPTILTCGTDAQKERYVALMRRTDEMWCQLFSEPGAGSDLASVQTKAVRDGDRWVINGQKVWTSGAQYAKFGYILCRTDTTVPKHEGMTAFIIPMDAPGVDVRPLRQMSGGSSFNEVFLTDVEIGDENRIADVGHGWRVAITTLGFERAASTGNGSGGGDLFKRLVMLGQHLGRNTDPLVRQQLATIYISGRVRAMTNRRAAANLKKGAVPGPEGSVGKLAWTNENQMISALAGDLLGASLTADSGDWGTFAWTEFVNGAPGYRVAGGSDEVQRNIIAERALGLPKDMK
jgi:alkylation response protein AidB-like acyl-CoA dehydrogenase